MSDDGALICRVPGCGGPASGVCLNGLEFDECPDVVLPEGGADPGLTPKFRDVVSTRSGETLSVADADALLRAGGGVLLAAVAGPNAGKTTLAATMYELAHRGRLDGLGFAGSETIPGFEKRCFLSRGASEQDAPETARTPVSSEVHFLHLRLALADGRRVDLLLSDRSGEHFDDALDEPARFAEFVELGRADAVLLLLDSELLADNHHAELARVRKLVLGMSHAGLLTDRSIHVVLTKQDRITTDERVAMVDRRADAIVSDLATRNAGTSVRLHRTECRARPGSSVIGQGVGELISAVLPIHKTPAFTTHVFVPPEGGGSALDHLLKQTRAD